MEAKDDGPDRIHGEEIAEDAGDGDEHEAKKLDKIKPEKHKEEAPLQSQWP